MLSDIDLHFSTLILSYLFSLVFLVFFLFSFFLFFSHLEQPENILCTNESDNAVLKIADFGISNLMKDKVKQHNVFGTPAYCGKHK